MGGSFSITARRIGWILTLLLGALFVLGPRTAAAACITVYDGAAPPDCAALQPADTWVPVTPPGQILLFKDLWGRGKARSGKPFAGPKRAGVGLAGPVCWTGSPPVLSLVPTSPDDGADDAWTPPASTEWQAVTQGGFCQVCCTGGF